MTPTAADPFLRHTFLGLLGALADAHGLEPDELEQRVWLRAAAEPRPSQPVARLRALTLQEFRRMRAEQADDEAYLLRTDAWPDAWPDARTGAWPDVRADAGTGAAVAAGSAGMSGEPEALALAAERARELRAAVARLPSRCPALVTALLESPPFSYRELAEELAMPRGSIGPTRSRCLDCLRRLLSASWDGS